MESVITEQLLKPVKATAGQRCAQIFPPIEQENRSHIETAAAAYYLSRKPQTMRAWACLENGPIRPHRINGRLAWAVSDIRRLLGQ